ncbi:ad2474b2-2951-49e8-94e9-b7bfd4e712e6 [Thermothielavioides terrestris]|jgi:hypothetical protein
MSSS